MNRLRAVTALRVCMYLWHAERIPRTAITRGNYPIHSAAGTSPAKKTPNKHSSTTTVLKAACSFFGAKEMMKCVSFTFSKKPHVEVCLSTTLTPIMSGQLRRPLSTSFQACNALKRPDSFGNIFTKAACFGIHLKRKC